MNSNQCDISMIPLLSQAILEQSTQITKLEKQIDLQNDEIKLLKSKVDNLQFFGDRRRNVAMELFCALILFFFVIGIIRVFKPR